MQLCLQALPTKLVVVVVLDCLKVVGVLLQSLGRNNKILMMTGLGEVVGIISTMDIDFRGN